MLHLARAAVITAVAAVIGYALMAPALCSGVARCEAAHQSIPSRPNAFITCGLAMALIYEVASLLSTFCGVRETTTLVPDIRSRCLPSFLLSIMFSIVVMQHSIFAGSETAWYAHAVPAQAGSSISGRPVYTLTYIEWLLVVPQLLIAAGYCALGRPMVQVAGPIILTNVYIIFAWMAFLTTSDAFRWVLIGVTFLMYGRASQDMVQWVTDYYKTVPADLPSRDVRPCLSLGLIALFSIYAVVYLSAITGNLSAEGERVWLLFLDIGAKVAMSISFVAIRATEYHQTLTKLLKKLGTSNVAMMSILRGSFDVLLPCTVDNYGRCLLPASSAVDMAKLEAALGRNVAGASFEDLLVDDEERERFTTYVMNTLRQADQPQAIETTLSTGGDWRGHMPPVAQVLNCKMAYGDVSRASNKHPAPTVTTAVHLSVVPQSALSFGRERRVVAAVRFGGGDSTDQSHEEALTAVGFEEFDAEEARLRLENEAAQQNQENGPVLIASLVDMAKLGVSALFTGGGGTSVAESEAYVASTVLEAMAGASVSSHAHWGALARMTRLETQMAQTLCGSWTGSVSEALGGYKQTIHFLDDRCNVDVEVDGITLHGMYNLHCDREPYQMDIQMKPKDESFPRPAPIRYIFKVDGSSLILCGPSGSDSNRPLRFEGPGLCVMRRTASGPRPQVPAHVSSGDSRSTGTSSTVAPSSKKREMLRNVTESTAEMDPDALPDTSFGRMITDSTLTSDGDGPWSRAVTEEVAGPTEAPMPQIQARRPQPTAQVRGGASKEFAQAAPKADAGSRSDTAQQRRVWAAPKRDDVHVLEFTNTQLAMTLTAGMSLLCLFKAFRM